MNKAKITQVIEQYKSPRIAIIGDFMIDQFIRGQVNRINPEAIAPLLSYENEYTQLGGAGFVSSILKKINSNIKIFGVIGDDSNAQLMKKLLDEQTIEYKLFTDKTRPTTCKQRIEAQNNHGRSINQQIIRLDYEKTHLISQEIEKKIIAKLDTQQQIKMTAKKIMSTHNFKNLIISLDKDGLFYHNSDQQQGFIPTKIQEIYDVSGAGDTIIAIIARFALSSLNIEELLTLANAATSIIIRQKAHKNINLKLLNQEINK